MIFDIGRLIDYETGELGPNETVDLFSDLIKTGMAWDLQGSYGRMAQRLIDAEYLDGNGNVLVYPA